MLNQTAIEILTLFTFVAIMTFLMWNQKRKERKEELLFEELARVSKLVMDPVRKPKTIWDYN